MSEFERKHITQEEWLADGNARFGEDRSLWKFKCVRCGHVQTARDFRDIGVDPDGRVYFSCIGRWKEGVGCDWTLGGLFQIHAVEVRLENGQTVPAFEFAD